MTSQEEIKEISNKDETELEKMRNRLTESGMYEEGMSVDDMMNVIKVLDESKEMHEIENSKSQSSSESPVVEESSPPPTSPTENNNEACQKSYANSVKNTSSPENAVITAGENVEEKATTESKSQTCPKENNLRPKVFPTEYYKKMLRRKTLNMDPLQVKLNENDRPLILLNRANIEDCKPFSWSNFTLPTEDLMEEMSNYLQEVRDEWIADSMPEADDLELQWGSPIEVGSRIFSSEKKMMTRHEAEPLRESRTRASKRKANSLIANISNVSDSEPEADDDSALLKKRKPQQERRDLSTSGSNVHMDIDIETVPVQTPSTSYSSYYIANQKKLENSEDEDIFEPPKKNKSPEIYPRKIIPTIPGTNKARRGRSRGGKTNFKGPRAKKSNDNSSKSSELEETSPPRKVPTPEIILDFESDELHDISPKTDIKMLKMPLAEKTKLAKQKLEEIKVKENEKIEEKIFNDRQLEEEKRKKQDEIVKKRIASFEEEKRSAKKKEDHDKEMKKKWNTVINDKGKRKEKNCLSDEEIRKNLEEDEVVICDDPSPVQPSGSGSSSSKIKVICPICNKFFPESDIENHASECNQFEVEVEAISSPVVGKRQRRNNKSDMQICHICRKFESCNDNSYMEHVQLCTELHRDNMDSVISGNQGDIQGNFSSERKNLNLRRRL